MGGGRRFSLRSHSTSPLIESLHPALGGKEGRSSGHAANADHAQCREPWSAFRPSVAPSDVAQGREHPGLEVVEQMAMQCPQPRIVGVEGDHDPASRRDQHRVAYRAGKALAVDFDDLKFVPVQMHRMRHPRLIDEDQFDALALGDG